MREGEMIYTLLGPEMTKNLHKALDSLNEQHLSPDIIRIKDELLEIKDKYGDERRSQIEYAGGDLSMEDMIPNEKVVITKSLLNEDGSEVLFEISKV